jgi:membrane-bound ClpP family serine protease
VAEESKPNICGTQGIVVKPLHPVGEIEIAGVRYAASCAVGTLDEGAKVKVISEKEFNLVVEAIKA